MDWDKLRIFHTVAKAGSLTRAGSLLNVSQSAVSRQISTLEKELDVELFQRHARGLVLTEQGEVLFKATRSIFAQVTTVQSMLGETQEGLSGTLRVATSVAFGSIWLSKRISKFCRKYPKINLQVILTDQEVDFTMREADLAICVYRHNFGQDVIQKPLFKFKLGIYASASYLEQHGKPESVQDLDSHSLVVFGEHTTPPVENINWLLHIGTKPGHIRNPHLVINNAYGILQAIKQGVGIASLPDYIAKDHSDIVPLFPNLLVPEIHGRFVYPKQLSRSRRLQAMYDFLLEELREMSSDEDMEAIEVDN